MCYLPDCDDVTDEGICLGSMGDCSEQRWRCELSDDFFHKKDNNRYYQRFGLSEDIKGSYILDDNINGFGKLYFENHKDIMSLVKFIEYEYREKKDLIELLEPIRFVCDKYNIDLKDLPAILEEYISRDNE